ncbi:MAG: hypothetical protein IJG51_09800 [Synergistaceae bacterium]|nr:hypothetical protein [Synergistaceae bacterium]MBQ3399171.1 hypothetical protein [Synergistaceae bacterium]MBQ3759432.1 hypothetical protein [Synergistaceae bacterium]MBQ4400908.1 hypothetical protein [Synergistaceae bacterium]MBQ6417155.1 hypothetical protein [Synergistaceae bacterium]
MNEMTQESGRIRFHYGFYAAMNDVISRMIKRNIDKAIDETNERVAKDMLKKELASLLN